MASRAAKRLGERVFAYGSAIGNVGGHVPWRVASSNRRHAVTAAFQPPSTSARRGVAAVREQHADRASPSTAHLDGMNDEQRAAILAPIAP